eukprot:gene1412-1781_t
MESKNSSNSFNTEEDWLSRKCYYNVIDDAMGYARIYGYIGKDQQELLQPFLIEKYEKDADKYWDKFYKKNNANFFKDRHWLVREFPEFLKNSTLDTKEENRINVFEIGCGVGNTTIPLLELNSNLFFYSFDFSEHAVKLLNQSVEENELCRGRCKGFVYNAIDGFDRLPQYVKEMESKMDLIVIIFVLSAIDPKTMNELIEMCKRMLATGGKVLIRDYAVDDMAQSRFDGKQTTSKISENFHVIII